MVWEYALTIFLLIMTLFIMSLIPTIFDLRKTLKKLSSLIEDINKELPEILQNLNEITDNTASASKKINNTVSEIIEVEQKIAEEIKQPLLETAATLGGILNGLHTFVTYFLRKKNE